MKNAKRLLTKWTAMSDQVDNSFQRKYLTILYTGLNQLPNDDRLFLAKKYFNVTKKPFSDKTMAEKTGMKISEYTKKRVEIEANLNAVIEPVFTADRRTLRERYSDMK